jgi:hypothetical protein
MGKPLLNLSDELARLGERSRRLSFAYVDVSVIGCVPQILHDI